MHLGRCKIALGDNSCTCTWMMEVWEIAESSLLVLPPSNMHPAPGIYTFIRVLCTSILPLPLCTLLTSSGAYCCLQGLPLRRQQHPHLRMTRYLITYSDLLSTNIELRLRDSGKVSSRDMSASPQNRRKILSLLSPCTTQKVVYKRYTRTKIVDVENRSRSIMPEMSL